MNRTIPLRMPVGTRLACAGASLALTGLLTATLSGLFHQVSPDPWLQPSPGLMAQKAHCDAQPDRGARQRCAQRVVAHRARVPQAVVVAALP